MTKDKIYVPISTFCKITGENYQSVYNKIKRKKMDAIVCNDIRSKYYVEIDREKYEENNNKEFNKTSLGYVEFIKGGR